MRLFFSSLVLFIAALAGLDRMFFKQNHSFCVAFLYPRVEPHPEWDLPEPDWTAWDEILSQKFHYLAKGCHCFAFVSEDQKYVIKFHRYASHLRRFSWAYHPFSYLLSERRKKIKEHNLERLQVNLQSYKDCYCDLKEETGLLLAHINPSNHLQRTVTLVDSMQAEYQVNLDEVTFVLQHKAEPFLPALIKRLQLGNHEEAKQILSSLVQLLASDARKGYSDKDPVLSRNYGLLGLQAIHIDVGDLAKGENTHLAHIQSVVKSLYPIIEPYPVLLAYLALILNDLD